MNGNFSQMKKRDNSSEYHKKSMRERFKKVKSSYIGTGYESEDKFEFTKLSVIELKKLERKQKKEKKHERIKTIIIILLLMLASFFIYNYLLND